MVDVLIVGGGPAGLTAGLYAARAGKTVLVIEKMFAGGQAATTNLIENYPGFAEPIDGPTLMMALESQAIRAGVTMLYEEALEIDCKTHRVRTDSGWHASRALILAVGASPRTLLIADEARYRGRGVSYCATCDGSLSRGQPVVVVGGGNTACEEALYLAGLSCPVTLLVRRDVLRADKILADRVQADPRITLRFNSQIQSLSGDPALATITLQDATKIHAVACFVAIGRVPDTALVTGQLHMDRTGYILANDDCQTSTPNVFAAGDARVKTLRQIVTAAADGAIAATVAVQALM